MNNSEVSVLESDAYDFAQSASLNQGEKPVAFLSRSLKAHEKKKKAIERKLVPRKETRNY
jgi:hypothetical protein